MAARVLIIEDEPEYRHLLQIILEQAGYLAATASSASAALRWLEDPASRPDVILLDIGLPDREMDGLALCRALKKDPAYQNVPVVIVTGRVENATALEANLSHADLVLHKPAGGEDLLKAVKAMLEKPASQRRGLLHRAGLELDPDKGTVFFHGRTITDLGQRLFDLFYLLVQNAPAAVPLRRILSELGLQVRDAEVYVLVCRLRSRLRREFGVPLVATVPGRGYKIDLVAPAAIRPP